MVGRTGCGTLGQFHKFASENIIETQRSGNLLGNIQMMSPPSIDVHFLKNKNVRIRIAQKIYEWCCRLGFKCHTGFDEAGVSKRVIHA